MDIMPPPARDVGPSLGDELDALLLDDARPPKQEPKKKERSKGEWSKAELKALTRAAAEVPSSVEK